MTVPWIGISTSEVRRPQQVRHTSKSGPAQRELVLGMPYVRAIQAAGGLSVVLPPVGEDLPAFETLIEGLDGVCLPGGPDIDPTLYGEAPHPQLGPIEPELDHFELALARAAIEAGLPILGICRGAQALNVARGGSLHQHLPDVTDGTVVHRQLTPGTETSHGVRRERGGPLAVNSFHHQGIARLGDGLRATAWASDETIEAFEAPGGAFCVGVQWHAETLVHLPEHLELFEAFVSAAAGAPAPWPADARA